MHISSLPSVDQSSLCIMHEVNHCYVGILCCRGQYEQRYEAHEHCEGFHAFCITLLVSYFVGDSRVQRQDDIVKYEYCSGMKTLL